MRRITLLCLALTAAAVPAWAQAKLDGWDKYKFGMNADQVRAVPGIAWGDLTKIPVPGGMATLDSKKPVEAFGGKFALHMIFDGGNRLTAIELGRSMEIKAEPCEAEGQKMVTAAEKIYGAFQPDTSLVKSYTPGVTYEKAGARSRFLVQSSETLDIGKVVTAVARVTQGKASVNLAVNASDPPHSDTDPEASTHICTLRVSFRPN